MACIPRMSPRVLFSPTVGRWTPPTSSGSPILRERRYAVTSDSSSRTRKSSPALSPAPPTPPAPPNRLLLLRRPDTRFGDDRRLLFLPWCLGGRNERGGLP